MKKVVLASGSPRREELLRQIGMEFTVCPSKGKEITSRTKPEEVVKELSYQKARDVFDRSEKDVLVLGADTVVYVDDRMLGKPQNEVECHDMLQAIQGRSHYVYTGVTVIWKGEEDGATHVLSFEEATKVRVHSMTEREIAEYMDTGESMDKAGGYGIQGTFARYIDRIEGDYNNVVGLPVARLYQELRELNLM